MERFAIAREHFEAVITGVETDLRRDRYDTWEGDLAAYCHRVASSVGLIAIEIFGYQNPSARQYAVHLGLAFQLTNILRDVAEDAHRGRIYLPREDLERFAGSRDALAARRVNGVFRDLLAFEVARTRTLFERGLPLADMVGRRLRHEVRIFARGGLAILARIESVGYDVFRRRPTLGRAELLRLVVRGLWR